MELNGLLIIIFLALAIIKTVLAILAKRTKPLAKMEEDLTFVLEVLSQLVVEITKIKEWIRSIEQEQEKKEQRG